MNSPSTHNAPPPRLAAEARLARLLAGRLDESAHQLPHDIAERLRVARLRAVDAAAAARRQVSTPVAATGGGTLTLGGPPSKWWRLASVVPLVALVLGLMMIDQFHLNEQIAAAADIDAALLTDDLPPQAYTDPGFSAYLRSDGAE